MKPLVPGSGGLWGPWHILYGERLRPVPGHREERKHVSTGGRPQKAESVSLGLDNTMVSSFER